MGGKYLTTLCLRGMYADTTLGGFVRDKDKSKTRSFVFGNLVREE